MEMATLLSILAWRILWTEEPGRLQSMGSLRVRHDLAARSVLPCNRPATPLFSPACWEPGFHTTGESIPLRGSEGVPGLPGAPQDEAGLTGKFETEKLMLLNCGVGEDS